MSKRKANLLASNYSQAKIEERKEMYFNELRDIMTPFKQSMRKKFNYRTLKRIDYNSIADEALMRAARKYDVREGNFDTYYGTWIRAMVVREAINNPESLKLPEYLAKKDFQISPEEKVDMINGYNTDDIKSKYNIKDNEFKNLVHYYREEPRFYNNYLEKNDNTDLIAETELREDIKRAFNKFPEVYLEVVADYYGLFGRARKSKSIVKRKYKVSVNKVIKELSEDEEFKRMLEDYNE